MTSFSKIVRRGSPVYSYCTTDNVRDACPVRAPSTKHFISTPYPALASCQVVSALRVGPIGCHLV